MVGHDKGLCGGHGAVRELPYGPGGHRALLQGHPVSWGWLGVPEGSPSWCGRHRALALHVTPPGQALGVLMPLVLWGQPGPRGVSWGNDSGVLP